ncbi:hypothetical protein FRB91_011624 [Serendipita sp. 411]|nr:hypothetical protein FRC18_009574 [Serendipita sp. 400]KAG8860995.1 hypothetical protein FRB91_011624 [Serendipita sp. 411]
MNQSSGALVLIDLQNDFLDPEAPFAVDQGSQEALKTTLSDLIPAFRASGGHIIWIKSHYALATKECKDHINNLLATPPTNAPKGVDTAYPDDSSLVGSLNPLGHNADVYEQLRWVIEGTHIGKRPCCLEGTFGADLVPWASAMVSAEEDAVVIKTFYSAFRDTLLDELLQSKNISEVYLCGLLSNMCVLATALHGAQLGGLMTICVVEDALAWRREESHRKALATMQSQGIKIMKSGDLRTCEP